MLRRLGHLLLLQIIIQISFLQLIEVQAAPSDNTLNVQRALSNIVNYPAGVHEAIYHRSHRIPGRIRRRMHP
ncbi:hypothetical protein GGU11DRAFT_794455 [Lentinula aff. detonsa]|nr:hypothetical protein GGU11DRAFT_794455 [Lentinula aff. detonsa]